MTEHEEGHVEEERSRRRLAPALAARLTRELVQPAQSITQQLVDVKHPHTARQLNVRQTPTHSTSAECTSHTQTIRYVNVAHPPKTKHTADAALT